MAKDLTMGEAAKALGVSVDTVRRWDKSGKIKTRRDERNRRVVSNSEVVRLTSRPIRHDTGTHFSARNRFPGVITSVEVDGVMALVEIQAGEFRVTAAITRDSVNELGLAPGVAAVATVKATSVMVDTDRSGNGR
jgi:molybdopterin-binding protein